jgi:hypothetical protein
MNCESPKHTYAYQLYVWPKSTSLSLMIAILVTLTFGPAALPQRLDGTLRVVVSDISGASVTDAKVTRYQRRDECFAVDQRIE